MTKALIVVDVQNDFCEGGALGVAGGQAVAAQIADLLASEHDFDHIVATRDHHIDPGTHFSTEPDFVNSWPPHCIAGTRGAELEPSLQETDFEAIFDKGAYEAAYSGFEGTIGGVSQGDTLADWLDNFEVDQVVVVGIATDFCVRATALDAVAEGFHTTVWLDLTAAVNPGNLDAVRVELEAAGVQVA